MNTYKSQANKFCRDHNVIITSVFTGLKKHFPSDQRPRDTYAVTIRRGDMAMTVDYGQSIIDTGKKPSKYDILSCLTKCDPGTFEDFCSDYGYAIDSRIASGIYEAVCKEWRGVKDVFAGIIEQLQEIG